MLEEASKCWALAIAAARAAILGEVEITVLGRIFRLFKNAGQVVILCCIDSAGRDLKATLGVAVSVVQAGVAERGLQFTHLGLAALGEHIVGN